MVTFNSYVNLPEGSGTVTCVTHCHTNMDAANGVFFGVPEAKVEPTRALKPPKLKKVRAD